MKPRGFVLVTSVLLLMLLATAVFLVTRQASTASDRAVRADDAATAEYVARAGLAHARWVANNSGCTGYDLPQTSFGGGTYDATFTPTDDSPVAVLVKGGSSSGASSSMTANFAVFDVSNALHMTLQMTASSGKDAMPDDFYDERNYGGADYLQITSQPSWNQRPLLEFDLSKIPANARVQSARLELKQTSVNSPGVAGVHRVMRSWVEGTKSGTGQPDGSTWKTYDGIDPWAALGGDFDSTLYGQASITSATDGQWLQWDISELVDGWVSGAFPNFGLMLVGDGTVDQASFASRQSSVAADAPRLSVTYACECGQVCGGGAGNALLVVVSPGDLTAQEADKKSLIEGWGYTVNLIDESDTQANFDLAIAANDVAYIPQDITSSNLDTKLRDATIGVVNEEGEQVDELGFSQDKIFKSRREIDVIDNSHYITQPFATGLLAFSAGEQSVHMLSGTDAPGLRTLGESLNTGSIWRPSLAVLEAGAEMYGGGSASGRRVELPWGGGTFDINGLTDDGRTIMQRALEWGAETPPQAQTVILATMGGATLGGLSFTDKDLAEYTPATDTATLFLDGVALSVANDFDAVHVLDNGHLVLSSVGEITLGGVTAQNEDLIDYDPVADTATMLFDGSTLFSGGSTDVSAVHVMDNGNLILTNEYPVTLGGLAFGPTDIIQYDPVADTATMFLNSGVSGATQWINAVHVFANGNIVMSAEVNDTIGGLSVTPDDLIEYDPAAGTASPFFDGALFSSEEDVRAAHVTGLEPPAKTHNVLLVVGDPLSLTPQQVLKRDLIESWGHSVSYVATSATQADIDAAVAAVDVVYVPELGTTPMFELGTKLDEATKGVVTEESRRTLLMSAFVLSPFVDTDSLDVTDTGHYLTQGFTTGPLLLSTSVQTMWTMQAPLADDLHVLGDLTGGVPGFAYLDKGELRNDSSPAPARRIKLPWGGFDFDVSLLTDDALEIMRRAILWGAAGGSGGGGGGGPTCAATIADDFETDDYTGNTGSLNWNGNWVEVNESTNPNAGDEQVVTNDSGNLVARVRDNDGGFEGILRSADLSAFTSAVISFTYWRGGLDNVNDAMSLEVWPNAMTQWEEVLRIEGPGTDPVGSPQSASIDVSSFIMNDTHFRFITSPTMGNTDSVFLDDIELCLN